MAKGRDAIDTITGYYYQFDYYILRLLELKNDIDVVCIEGIEDVDITELDETTAVQCKYYAKTEYNHSIIAKPIRFMLINFASSLKSGKTIKYKLFGNYKSGQEKLPPNITVDFARKSFFSYTNDKVKHELHNELGLKDDEIKTFLDCLDIDINAVSYEEQEKKIIQKFQTVFSCTAFEAEYYYYNSALRFVKRISTKQLESERIVTKKNFIQAMNFKQILFDNWYLQFKGVKEYCKSVRTQYFSPRNISPYERIFMVECDEKVTDMELVEIVLKISKNWSKLSKREIKPFCPYIYFHKVTSERIISIKKLLQKEDIYFWDGYDFCGAEFSVHTITRKANAYNEVKVKIINELKMVDEIINYIDTTKEVYQFHVNENFYYNNKCMHSIIPIEETNNINMMI